MVWSIVKHIVYLAAVAGITIAIFKPWISLISLDELDKLSELKEIAKELKGIQEILREMKNGE